VFITAFDSRMIIRYSPARQATNYELKSFYSKDDENGNQIVQEQIECWHRKAPREAALDNLPGSSFLT
jgi:hypothetical protein